MKTKRHSRGCLFVLAKGVECCILKGAIFLHTLMESIHKKRATRILIIEDDLSLSEIMHRAFQQAEFDVFSARTGEEGIEQVKTLRPQVIVLDILLPDIDGFEVLKRIKQDEAGKKAQVILLSNLDEVGDMERALSLGATTYLVKAHYTPQQIIDRVKMMLKERIGSDSYEE